MSRTKNCNIKDFVVAGMVDGKILYVADKAHTLTDSGERAMRVHYAKVGEKIVSGLNAAHAMKRDAKGHFKKVDKNAFYLMQL